MIKLPVLIKFKMPLTGMQIKRSWDVAFGGSKTRVVQLVEDVANRRKVVVERVKYGGE
jgi:hypothetical protein